MRDGQSFIGLSAVTAGGSVVGWMFHNVNTVLTTIVLICSAIVGVYGVIKIFRDVRRCSKCPDRPK